MLVKHFLDIRVIIMNIGYFIYEMPRSTYAYWSCWSYVPWCQKPWKYALLLCLLLLFFCPFPCCQTHFTHLSGCYNTKKLPISFYSAISKWLRLVLKLTKTIRIVLKVNRFQNLEYKVYNYSLANHTHLQPALWHSVKTAKAFWALVMCLPLF